MGVQRLVVEAVACQNEDLRNFEDYYPESSKDYQGERWSVEERKVVREGKMSSKMKRMIEEQKGLHLARPNVI